MELGPITIGLIAHRAADCPAEHKDKADDVVPALRNAAEAGKVPKTLAFVAIDHGGVFGAAGNKEEVTAALPDLPYHEVELHDASHDPVVRERVAAGAAPDEADRREFVEHAQNHYFPERFPTVHESPIVAGTDLADFIEAKHQ